jgi:protein TonB
VLVESAGRLKTQSKFWTLGTFALNSGILAIMILLPLMHPEALPKAAFATMLIAPAPPPPPAMPVAARPAAAQSSHTAAFTAPRLIPRMIREDPGPPSVQTMGPMAPNSADNVASNNPLSSILGPSLAIHVAKPADHLHLSYGVAAGNLIFQTKPVYPPIAQAAHITGTVVLRAIISKSGTIENLTVQSGPPILRQAALDGVRNWRYKPFLLNGEPTDVDTTITVNFIPAS